MERIRVISISILVLFLFAGCNLNFNFNINSSKGPKDAKVEVVEFISDEDHRVNTFVLKLTTADNEYMINGYQETVDEKRVFLERYYYEGFLLYVTNVTEDEAEYYFGKFKDSVPLELSGDSSDHVTTDKNEFFETEYCCVFVPENTELRGDTADIIDNICEALENESGLKFDSDSPYADLSYYMKEKSFPEKFWDVNPDKTKIDIVVSNNHFDHNEVNYGEVMISAEDLDFDKNNGNLVHDLAHVLQKSNGPQLDEIMAEGFATYMTEKVIHDIDGLKTDFNAYKIYSGDPEIDRFTIQDRFECSEGYHESNYEFGFRFVTYLYETYGKEFFIDYLKDVSVDDPDVYDLVPPIKSLEALKDHTSGSVLKDFVGWLDKNEERFSG
ncbi:MAG: hypothetical protein J6U23_15095 [Clostridiales bacterium]|nr:hypothetical protein [Clostridiales bacterium]